MAITVTLRAAPTIKLTAVDGKVVDLGAAFAAKPTILIFYRGSWCPYCNKQLAALGDAQEELQKLGYQILASPDTAEGLKAMAGKNHLTYQLLSEHEMTASAAYGVAVQSPETERPTGSTASRSLRFRTAPASGCRYPEHPIGVVGGDGHHQDVNLSSAARLFWKLSALALLGVGLDLRAQELSGLGGVISKENFGRSTYTWQIDYRQDFTKYYAGSIANINEGHLPGHHRDSDAMELWARLPLLEDRMSLAAGVGGWRLTLHESLRLKTYRLRLRPTRRSRLPAPLSV